MQNEKPEMNVEWQYQKYLELCKLHEENMPPVQQIETRRAFYAGFAQCLFDIAEHSNEDEDKAVEELNNLASQLEEFWSGEVKRK
jgi:hypothetical protein